MQAFVLNKPAGCISARRDFAGRPTIYDHVPSHFPELPHVGRLDYNSEGLLLFTDDGRLAQGLLNPGFKGSADPASVPPIEKVYELKLRDRMEPDDPQIAELARPVEYGDGTVTRPAKVTWLRLRTRATWVQVTISEGRHHQLRMAAEQAGLQLLKLRRVRFGPIELGELKPRWCRPLTELEVAALYAVALPGEERPAYASIDDSETTRASRPGQSPAG